MTPAVVAHGVSKRYHVGRMQHETMLRDLVTGLIKHPLRSNPFRKKKTDSFWALKDVSFDVGEGQVVGVIGRNGAGKSTLLKLLSRITYPTEGSIRVRGRVASLLEVGTGFHNELTGRENIYLNGSIMGMRKREVNSLLDEIIEFSGVRRFIDTPIKRYSSGMKLRLGFAVAAHLNPDVLLCDEVLAVGDAAFQKKCLAAMDDLRSGGRTVLFVSHNMEAVQNLCSRVIWIDNGEIRKDDESETVIREYLKSFAYAQKSGLDLTHYEHRRGSGEAQITGVEFLDLNRESKEVIRAGEPLVIRIHFAATQEILVPHFGIRIHTPMGTMLTELSTWTTGLEIARLSKGRGSIDFEIDMLNLMPARYYLSLWIQGARPLVHYDVLENCVELNVETIDYYQSGRPLGNKFGVMFFPCRWHAPEFK